MSFTMHGTGNRFLADMLAGSGKKVNGMYVEYGTAPDGDRSFAYFDGLACDGVSGYARIAVSSAYVDDDCTVHFNGLLTPEDVSCTKSPLTCATLVHMEDDDPSKDTVICTIPFPDAVYAAQGSFTAVHTSMKIGA